MNDTVTIQAQRYMNRTIPFNAKFSLHKENAFNLANAIKSQLEVSYPEKICVSFLLVNGDLLISTFFSNLISNLKELLGDEFDMVVEKIHWQFMIDSQKEIFFNYLHNNGFLGA